MTPCRNCITKAVCRHKTFANLTKDCTLIEGYKIRDISLALDSTVWRYNIYSKDSFTSQWIWKGDA